ncbi:hypothetical protein CEE69_15290 [Rhodopirellula bahusiensis]|uniref:Uncharacterized protein n=1 Tax=Rhodopirellula bahusiensis TaxID=2014065 RepID=A0A2G1W6C7_9BACT|nr:hypothetical protein CEE69_15290 [Rhodopirellula bahusiensis]
MDHQSPLTYDEACFTKRLLFETLNFNEPIERTAETKFRDLGLSNGAIENFIRVMKIVDNTMLAKIYEGHEPLPTASRPWKTQAAFLERVSEIQDWLSTNDGEPCGVEPFLYEDKRDVSPQPRKLLSSDELNSLTRQNDQ